MSRPSQGEDSFGDDDRVRRERRRVLLVDDHDDSLEMLAQILSFSGFATAGAKSGSDALAKARELRPDVVVTDLRLPGIDGFGLTRKLREDRTMAGTRIIILSGVVESGAEQRARDAGCDAFLRKPCMPDALVLEIGRVLEAPSRTGTA